MTSDLSADTHGWAGLEQWGSEPRMNDLEALMWRGERHPEFSSTGVVVELLDSVPDWERFRAAHAWGVGLVPRLRQRVVEPALPVGPPAWVEDPDFDLDYHVRRIHLPAPSGLRELLDFAQLIGETPMDRSRPLWTGTLVDNLEGGRAAYVLQSHHCLMDGAAAIQLFGGVHSHQAAPTPDKPAAEPVASEVSDAVAMTVDDIATRLRRAPGAALRAVASVRRAVAAPSDTMQFVGSMRRVLSPPAGSAPSPLIERQAGRAWRYGVLECTLAELKAAGRAAGGSVNDAYMAALLGGLRRYHEKLGIELGDIPVAMPVSIRNPDDAAGGNRFAGVIFAGPAGNPDPAERIAGVRGAVLTVRAEPAVDLLGTLAPVLSRAPSALLGAALGAMPRVDLSGSNVPGLTAPAYAAGAAVERMFVFGSLPNASMLATLCSYVGTCCIGLNCDGAVFTDTDLLWACMREGLDEVLDLGRAAPLPKRPSAEGQE
jgi:diacylglycerol O-acyltransferase